MELNKKGCLLIVCIVFFACCNNKQSDKELNKAGEETKCIELPNFIINKKQINDKTIVIECYLDDNSIHQFKDGEHPVNIIPIIRNETKNEELFIDKKTLVGYDTIDSPNTTKLEYSIMFPSPKGGDVRIYKVLQ